jgi:hypothetical protein
MNQSGTIVGGSIGVDAADGSRGFQFEVRKNDSIVETLNLNVGNVYASSIAFSTAYVNGDVITAWLLRISGSGTSTFNNESGVIEVS